MTVGDAYVIPGFLTPQLFFPKPPTTFLTCFCRGERRKYARRKSRLNRGSNSQPPGHETDTVTTEPPGRTKKKLKASRFYPYFCLKFYRQMLTFGCYWAFTSSLWSDTSLGKKQSTLFSFISESTGEGIFTTIILIVIIIIIILPVTMTFTGICSDSSLCLYWCICRYRCFRRWLI